MIRPRLQIEYAIEPLSPGHDRAAFECGVPALNAYLQRQARQDVERDLATVFILTPDSKTVSGFYTLSANSIQASDLPEPYSRKYPRFPLPVTLLGRMAVNRRLQGQRLGEYLLLDALERALIGSRQIASLAVIVDAKLGARDFYLKHDFAPFPLQPERMFLTMADIARMFA